MLDRVDRQLEKPRAHRPEEVHVAGRQEAVRPFTVAAVSIPFRARVSATSRAVSSAEKTSVTPRPKTRWKIGRMSG